MTKRQLIDEIVTLNHTAEPAFLARFEDQDLREYLDHLQASRAPRPRGEANRYNKYFVARSVPEATFGLDVNAALEETEAAERAALLAKEPPAEAPEPTETAERAARLAATSVAATTVVAPTQTPIAQEPAAQADLVQADDAEGDDSCSDLGESETLDSADSDAAGPEEEDTDEEQEGLDQEIEQDQGREEEAALRAAEDSAEADLAGELRTTRRDSVSARIAKAWREVPQVAAVPEEDALDVPRETDCDEDLGELAESRPASSSAEDSASAGADAEAETRSAGRVPAKKDLARVDTAQRDPAEDDSALDGSSSADVAHSAAAAAQDLAPAGANDEDEPQTYLF